MCASGELRPAPMVFSDRCVAPISSHFSTKPAHFLGSSATDRKPALYADVVRVTAGVPGVASHALHRAAALVVGRKQREPPVSHPGDPAQHLVGAASEPDGDGTLDRKRVDPGVRDLVPPPVQCHQVLAPQGAHHLDLLLRPAAPVVEVLPQRLVLDGVPAYTHAEPQPSTGQHVDRGGLLGHEGRLALRQDYHPADQLNALGDPRQVSEQDEGLVKHVRVPVRPGPPGPARDVGPEDVIERQQVVEAHLFGSLGVVPYGCGVRADLRLWKDNPYLHTITSRYAIH